MKKFFLTRGRGGVQDKVYLQHRRHLVYFELFYVNRNVNQIFDTTMLKKWNSNGDISRTKPFINVTSFSFPSPLAIQTNKFHSPHTPCEVRHI